MVGFGFLEMLRAKYTPYGIRKSFLNIMNHKKKNDVFPFLSKFNLKNSLGELSKIISETSSEKPDMKELINNDKNRVKVIFVMILEFNVVCC